VAQTHIDLAFADGTYRCALGLGQVNEIQTKCKMGIGAIYARVLQGRVAEDISVGHPMYAAFYQEDLVEVMRQGLIGGGQGMVDGAEVKVGPLRANELIERYFLPLPLVEQWNLAAAILYAKVEGYEEQPDAPPIDEAATAASAKKKAKGGSTTPRH
jgi:hypothetical protein